MRILLTISLIIMLVGCGHRNRDYNDSYHRNYNGWKYNEINRIQREIRRSNR